MLQEGFFNNRSGLKLHFMEQKSYDSDLKPVLIVPALPEGDMDYKDVIFVLQNHTVCFTPRGREQSDAPETGYTLQDHANDIIDCIEHFKLTNLIVIAFSRGVTYFIKALPEIKDKIAGIVIIDYPPKYEKHPTDWAKLYLGQNWRAMPMKERFPRPWVLEKIEQESLDEDLWNNLEGITCPVTLFKGNAEFSDPVLIASKVTEEDLNKYKQILPEIKVISFEDSGHDLRLWEYEKFIAEIKNFIQELTPKREIIYESPFEDENNDDDDSLEKAKLYNDDQNKVKKSKKTFFGLDKEKIIKLK